MSIDLNVMSSGILLTGFSGSFVDANAVERYLRHDDDQLNGKTQGLPVIDDIGLLNEQLQVMNPDKNLGCISVFVA